MARKRRHKIEEIPEQQILNRGGRWTGLREQQRLIAMNHTVEENDRAQALCRQLVDGTFNADSYLNWGDLFGEK